MNDTRKDAEIKEGCYYISRQIPEFDIFYKKRNGLNTRQPVYLLAGGRGKGILSTFDIVKNILHDTGKIKPVVAYVGVASLRDNWLFYIIIAFLIRMQCRCVIRRAVISSPKADLKKARKILNEADAVFFSGGDVEAGIKILREKDMLDFFHDLAQRQLVFFGISAGSILMSKEWILWNDPQDDSTVEIFPCLGLVPVICDTHAENDNWVELKTLLKLEKPGTVGYGLTSGSCLKVFPEGRIEVEEGIVARFKTVNGQVERQADLVSAERH